MQKRRARTLLIFVFTLLFSIKAFALTTALDEIANTEEYQSAVTHTNNELRKLHERLNALTSDSSESIPSGTIVMWGGAIADIPDGWALCNGLNGTPDLTDRFILPADADAGGTNNVGDTGGSSTIDLSHTHTGGTLVNTLGTTSSPFTATITNRYVGPSSGSLRVYAQDGGTSANPPMSTNTTSATSGSTASSLSSTQSIINKYYALAFIMKL